MNIFYPTLRLRHIGCLLLGMIPAGSLGLWAGEVVPKVAQPASTPPALEKQLQRELGEAAVAEEENPFLLILQQMRESEILLGQGETGPRTQRIQEQILAELDALIARARQTTLAKAKVSPKVSSGSVSPGSAQGPTTPSNPKEGSPGQPKESTAKSTPGATPGEEKTADIQHLRTLLEEVWGLLPQRRRQQMLEVPVEEFLPQYKPLIIEYFKRVAELRSSGVSQP